MKRALVFGLIGCVAGWSLTHFLRPAPVLPDEDVQVAPRALFRARPAVPDEAGALAADVKLREQKLGEKENELQRAREQRREASSRPLSYDEWYERQREVNPTRYAQLTNGVYRSVRKERQESSELADLFDWVETTGWGSEDERIHREYVALWKQRKAIDDERLARMESTFGEERPKSYTEDELKRMRAVNVRINELNMHERYRLMAEAAILQGVKPEEAVELAQTMHRIMEVTFMQTRRFLQTERENYEQGK